MSPQAAVAPSTLPSIRGSPLYSGTTLNIEDYDDINPAGGASNPAPLRSCQVNTGGRKETANKQQAPEFDEPMDVDREVLNGVTIADIDAVARRQFKLPASLRGAVVVKIKPESAAFRAGLRLGDVIQGINRQSTRNVAEAMKANKNLLIPQVFTRVWSQGSSRYLIVDKTMNK